MPVLLFAFSIFSYVFTKYKTKSYKMSYYSSVSISISVPSRKWKCKSPPSWTSTLSNTMFTISGQTVSSGGSVVSCTICPARHFSKAFPSMICFFHAVRKPSRFSTMPFHAVRNACSKSFSKRLQPLHPATPFCL